MRQSICALCFILCIGFSISLHSAHAQLVVQQIITITGTIESVSPGILVVKDEKGDVHEVRIQDKDAPGVSLKDGKLLRFPAEVRISGELKPESLQVGQNIRFQAEVTRLGRTRGEVKQISLLDGKDTTEGIKVVTPGEAVRDFSLCEMTCQVSRISEKRMVVKIPPNGKFTKKAALSFQLAKDAQVTFESDDYRRAAAGAKVTRLVAARLNTGDLVAKTLEVQVTSATTKAAGNDDKLLAKYSKFSDDPRPPRLIRSLHFAFMTDVSDRQAQIILDKLETMVTLLTKYFGRNPTGIVEGYIVRDLTSWPDGALKEPQGISKIRESAGICFNYSLGNKRRAILYSCDDHGVIQHECTHGFCHLAFGSTGPTWLAEGVAEMGQYWKFNERAVDINPSVMSYLKGAPTKRKLLQIAIPGRTNSGTWQDYAWRWALCHLLANNPNYSDRFKPLAIALMEKREGVSFTAVYGPVANQISFEYDLFLKTLDNGYRADLAAWPWNAKFKPLQPKRRSQAKIQADHGWQASGLKLVEGLSYDIASVGKWKIAADGSEYEADGDSAGRGKLVGVIFKDFKLSDPFPLGKRTTLVAPSDGLLFMRCQDDWNRLADNSGEVTVHLRITPEP